MIERIPASSLNRRLDEWKALQQEGWSVTALAAPDRRTVVLLACRVVNPT